MYAYHHHTLLVCPPISLYACMDWLQYYPVDLRLELCTWLLWIKPKRSKFAFIQYVAQLKEGGIRVYLIPHISDSVIATD